MRENEKFNFNKVTFYFQIEIQPYFKKHSVTRCCITEVVPLTMQKRTFKVNQIFTKLATVSLVEVMFTLHKLILDVTCQSGIHIYTVQLRNHSTKCSNNHSTLLKTLHRNLTWLIDSWPQEHIFKWTVDKIYSKNQVTCSGSGSLSLPSTIP